MIAVGGACAEVPQVVIAVGGAFAEVPHTCERLPAAAIVRTQHPDVYFSSFCFVELLLSG